MAWKTHAKVVRYVELGRGAGAYGLSTTSPLSLELISC